VYFYDAMFSGRATASSRDAWWKVFQEFFFAAVLGLLGCRMLVKQKYGDTVEYKGTVDKFSNAPTARRHGRV
jgi:hypothetical protein